MLWTGESESRPYVPDLQTGPGTHESNECDMRGSQPPRQKAPTPQSPYTEKQLAGRRDSGAGRLRTRATWCLRRAVAVLCALCAGVGSASKGRRSESGGEGGANHCCAETGGRGCRVRMLEAARADVQLSRTGGHSRPCGVICRCAVMDVLSKGLLESRPGQGIRG